MLISRKLLAPLAMALVVVAHAGCRDAPPPPRAPLGPTPDSFRVTFATSRGTFVVQSVRAWSPDGVDRFYALASEGFFDDNRFYRVIPGFIAQFGASDDSTRNKGWDAKPIPDDSARGRQKNLRGTVSFAALGPGSRTHQLFINLKDNPHLDAAGFAPVGRIVQGMEVADSIYSGYGEKPQYDLIATMGNRYLARMFPKLDHIVAATITTPK